MEVQPHESHWNYKNDHFVTFVDWEKWSPSREVKIQGYLEIKYGTKFELGTLSMGNPTVYTFKQLSHADMSEILQIYK